MTSSSDARTTPQSTTVWPRTAADLTDTTRCPACLAVLGSALCTNCGLDLSHPLAHKLAALSTEIAEQFAQRSALIEQIRREAAPAQQPVPPVIAEQSVIAGQSVIVEQPLVAAQQAAPTVHAAPSIPIPSAPLPSILVPETAPSAAIPQPPYVVATPSQPAAPRRSGVQLTLLVTGIVLVSVFAIFFIVYAFINYGLVWRSVIIGFVTLATLVAASLLRRRKLTASAEGIAALGVVLLLLDVFAVRANGMLGADRVDGAIYWGVALLVLTVALWLWHRLARVRTARIAASLLLVPGAYLLATGISEQIFAVDLVTGHVNNLFMAALVAAVAGLVHAAIGRRAGGDAPDAAVAERLIIVAITVPAIIAATVLALGVAANTIAGATLALLGVAAVTAAHWYLTVRRHGGNLDTGLARAFAGATGVLTVTGATMMPLRIDWGHNDELVWVLPAVTALIAAIIWFIVARPTTPSRPLGTRTSTIGALSVAAIALTPPTLISVGSLLGRSTASLLRQRTTAFDHAADITALHVTSVAVLAGAIVAIWLLVIALKLAPRATPTLAVAAAIVALTAAPLLPVLWAMLLCWLLIGAAGLFAARHLPAALRPAAHTAAIAGFALAWVAGWASPATWPITSVLAIGALLFARWRSASAPLRSGATVAATVLALIASATAAHQLLADVTNAGALGAGIMGALLTLGAGLAPGPRASLDRRLVFWIGTGTAGFVAVGTAPGAAFVSNAFDSAAGQSPLRLALAASALAAVLVWQVLSANRKLRIESSAAGALTAPALAWLAVSALDFTGVTDAAPTTIAGAAAIVAAASAAVFIGKPAARLPLDAGVAAVSVVALFVGLATREQLWLVLLVTAVATLLLAISRDGIVASASPRKHIGWVALTLATAALWTQLIERSVTAIEAYVLPLAAALLLIAALAARADHRRDSTTRDTPGSPWLTLAGLLIAVVPLALSSYGDHVLRAIFTLAAAAVLLLGGITLSRASETLRAKHLHAAAIVGAAGLVIATVVRAITAIARDGEYLEIWLAPGVITLVVAGIIMILRASGARTLGALLFSGGLGIFAITEVAAIYATSPNHDTVRASATIAILSLAHVAAALALRSTATAWATAWATAGLAAVTVIATIAVAEPAELVTAPLAIALLITGAVRLARNPALRSWPWLGPGTALLLLPSLLATIGDRPLWRLVGLGIVALAITVIAVILRLQAPFILGVSVLLIHGIATLQPQIRAVYELADWYVWAGIGGALLIALAIRYERRIRDLKKAVSSIRSLR